MRVVHYPDHTSVSVGAAALVTSEIERKPGLLLCPASGRSTLGLYRELASLCEARPELFEALNVVKLDEWCGVPESDRASCEHYLRHHVLDPLRISPERYVGFASSPADPAAECERIRAELERRGPIDLCVLGLGANGHVGFNEPAPFLAPQCHVARLSEATRRHAMVRSLEDKPRWGLTLGMGEILASKKIVLVVAGDGKAQAIEGLLSGRVSTMLPASFLWLHDDVECLIDRTTRDA